MADDFTYMTGEGVYVSRGPYSPVVIWNDLVFVSGLLAVKTDGTAVSGDIREEAMVVLRNLEGLLEAAGSSLERVISVNVYLGDIGDFMAFNEVYEEFFKPPYPARSAMGVSLPPPFQVLLSAIACLEGGGK